MLAKGFFCMALMVALVACNYPTKPKITKGFRQLTITYNASAETLPPNKTTGYYFDYKLANKPSYFVLSSIGHFNSQLNVTINYLLIDETITYRVRYVIDGTNGTGSDYSPYYNISTKKASLASVSVIPGKPLAITVVKNPDPNSTHSAIVTWNDPMNVQKAVNENDKDIQYQLDICSYNRFEPTKRTGCKTWAKMLRDKSTFNQTSMNLGSKYESFYKFNFHPSSQNELVYILTPVALNGTKGESGEAIKRIDYTKTPPTPSKVNASDIYAHQLTLSWEQGLSDATAYVEISPHYTQHEVRKATSNPFVITGLKNSTEYEFKVGIYSDTRGGSAWSSKFKFTTANETKPTPAPPTNKSNVLASSIVTMAVSLFIVLKLC